MGKFTFAREERLKREKDIQELFDKGSSFYLFPFKVIFMAHPDQAFPHHQVLISVSKRNFKRAVDRNLIKRRMREAYRLQKHEISSVQPLRIGFIYSHKEILLFPEMKSKLLRTFSKLKIG